MSGLLLVCTWLVAPRLAASAAPLGMVAPFVLLASLAQAAAAGLLGPLPSPRMDFDEWTPLGHGDPLKNDPTYDYVPPVLDRVHYWMEEGSARRDVDLGAVPVPATMLVPPPPPPAAPTTPAPAAGGVAAHTGTPPAYSSLNPFHHFEDRPVVPNVLFEETPFGGFDAPPFADAVLDAVRDAAVLTPSPSTNVVVQHQPLAGPTPLLPTPAPRPPSPNAIRAEPAKSSKLAMPLPPRGPPPPQPMPPKAAVKPLGRPPSKPTRHDDQPQPPPPPHLPPKQPPPPPQHPMSTTTPRPASTTPPALPPTTSSRPSTTTTTTSSSISSLVRGLLHREAATTASTLTTDPLFAHYKQPVTPVHGPAYLIIQGHSKVKTYGPVLRRI